MIELINEYPIHTAAVAFLFWPFTKYLFLPITKASIKSFESDFYNYYLAKRIADGIYIYKRSAYGSGFNPCAPSMESEVSQLINDVKVLKQTIVKIESELKATELKEPE